MNERQDVRRNAGTSAAQPGTASAAQPAAASGPRPRDARDPSANRSAEQDRPPLPEAATGASVVPSDDPGRGRNGQDDSVAESIGRAISAPIRSGR